MAIVHEVSPDGRQSMAGVFEQLTISTAAVPLTATKYKVVNTTTHQATLAHEAFITVEAQPIRWTVDGTTPTSSIGHTAVAGDVIRLVGLDNIARFQAIRSGGSDAQLSVTYLRPA